MGAEGRAGLTFRWLNDLRRREREGEGGEREGGRGGGKKNETQNEKNE